MLFLLLLIAAATPWSSPPIALAVGIVVALTGLGAFEKEGKKASRFIIQVCVVLLGLRIDLATLAREAGSGLVFAAATIVGSFVLGFALEKLLRTGKELTLLISSGTAICGGSAIAAVGATIGASSSAMAVATGCVFILNAVALYAFPAIGHWLHLSDLQFGTWAGVAIHDVSSVVGAASGYHAAGDASTQALDTANIIKLTRVLWILPCALFASWVMKRERGGPARAGAPFPWFVLMFLVASAIATFVPAVKSIVPALTTAAKLGFAAALFLIGAGLSRAALAAVGWRVLLQAFVQWLVLAGAALAVVRMQI